MSHQPELARRWAEKFGPTPTIGWCIECADAGKVQIVRQRLGAWNCPTHRDLGHVRFTNPRGDRNELRERATANARSAEEIAPPIPTPETDAAPPDGSGIKVIMLAGAIKAWWLHSCPICDRFHDQPTMCKHTGTAAFEKLRAVPTVPMWDSPLHRNYLKFRNEFQAGLIATNRYLTYAPHNAIKGRWVERMQAVNDAAIANSDLMVVMSPRNIPTDGTDAEVIYAAEHDVPILYVPSDRFTPATAVAMVDEFFDIQESRRG